MLTKRIKNAYLFQNGNLAVFGFDGQQIPELQGIFFDVDWVKIVKHSDSQTKFLMGTIEMSLIWYFEKYHPGKVVKG